MNEVVMAACIRAATRVHTRRKRDMLHTGATMREIQRDATDLYGEILRYIEDTEPTLEDEIHKEPE